MAAEEQVTIWERVERPARVARTTLEHGQIAAAAIELADAEGLDAVSMRRLAGHLGVATMALYRYVSSKEDIFWLMVDRALADVTGADDDAADWRVVARAHAEQSREVILRHPWLVEVSGRIFTGLTPNRMAAIERAMVSLDGLGLDADTLMAVLNTINSYVWGATGNEVSQAQLMRRQGWSTGDDLRNAYGPHMRWLIGTGRYPTFHRYITEAKRKDDATWRFEFGLDCVIEGIGARLGI
jgi:AcrR family transcriptional regulator